MDGSPFHSGEQALQEASGVRERMEHMGRNVIRSYMPDPHRELFEKLPTLWLGTLDEDGQPWATLLTGARGFVESPDPQTLQVAARLAESDPAASGLRLGAAVGLLGLEPHTRRRNRMNGVLGAVQADGFAVTVVQSYGNCPRYIQGREPVWHPDHQPGPVSAEGPLLSAAARRLIERSDTLFIASSSGPRVEKAGEGGAGVDVSHRGGRPGFVQLTSTPEGDRLTLPNYQGNAMFNTLGNLLNWPRAGLLFIDWESGDMLQLAATAEIVAPTEAQRTEEPAPQMLLNLQIERGWWRSSVLPFSWTEAEPAPQFQKSLASV